MEEYCMYLRKSRADLDAEARGEGETLKKHRTTLLALAKKMKINISEVYSEIVSGERITERPVVQKVLQEVEEGRWTGVLVVEVERLARGDTMDQGLVAQAFKYSSTKIITPVKVYDPNNEFDEEYFEFGLFMSRREFKTITRRLQKGRYDSVDEGNFIGSIAPYGYTRIRLADGSPSLKIDPERAPVVKMLFDLYTQGGLGLSSIAKQFNLMSIPTKTGVPWSTGTIKKMLTCDTYAGRISWNKRKIKKVRRNGVLVKTQPTTPKEEWRVVKGKHEAIISEEIFDLAQEILASRYHPPAPKGVIKSSLASLIICGACGKKMVRHPYKHGRPAILFCQNNLCNNVSSVFTVVEDRVLEALKIWVENHKVEWGTFVPEGISTIETGIEVKEGLKKGIEKTLTDLRKQSGNLHDLLEQGAYDIDTFLQRSQILATRISEAEEALRISETDLQTEMQRLTVRSTQIPLVEHVLNVYPLTDDPALRNALLRSVMEFATYKKEKSSRWATPGTADQFDLKIYPKLPLLK